MPSRKRTARYRGCTRERDFSLRSFVPFPQGILRESLLMNTHTVIKITVAALALALIPNIPAQTSASGASEPKVESKATTPAPAPAADTEAADSGSMNVSICYEAFSLPIAKAGELQRKGMTDQELYKEVVNIGKLERMLVLRTKSGQRSVLANTSDFRYPTTFNLSEVPIPQQVEIKAEDAKKVAATSMSLVPMCFEHMDVGDSVEVEPTLSPGFKTVNSQISVSHIAFAKKEKWGEKTVEFEQPQFETQKLNTSFVATVGSPCLIGTLNPPFGNGLAGRTEQNVWFCFITATVTQNNASPQQKSAR